MQDLVTIVPIEDHPRAKPIPPKHEFGWRTKTHGKMTLRARYGRETRLADRTKEHVLAYELQGYFEGLVHFPVEGSFEFGWRAANPFWHRDLDLKLYLPKPSEIITDLSQLKLCLAKIDDLCQEVMGSEGVQLISLIYRYELVSIWHVKPSEPVIWAT